ncbi:MAG: extracellular solute-binding protein [Lachnospiraceae bacterium]|nr:extracellular solute-binding protein [Lachnospiraceae bacterium]
MKKTGKVLAAVLIMAMVMSLMTGCGAGKKSGKITIFQSKTEIMTDLNQLAKDYTAETGVEVEVWETTGDNYYSDLKTGLSTQAGATLFSLQPGAESIEMADYLADLSGLSFVNKIGAGMADEINGKVVGIPYTVEGFGLVYNKNMVDAASIATTGDLINYLKTSEADNPLGLSQEDYFLIAHILNAPFAVQADPQGYLDAVLNGSERMADNDAFIEFAELMEAIRESCTNPVDITYDNNCGDFATGKTAMIHQGNWCTGMFADYNVDFDMSLAPVPVTGNKKISVSVPIAWYVNTDATEEEQKLAKDFLEWLYTSETGKTYMMDKFNFIPVVDGMKNNNLDPINQAVSEAVISGNTIPWVMSNWPAGIVTTDLAPITKEFFTTDMSGIELVDKLNDAFVAAAK